MIYSSKHIQQKYCWPNSQKSFFIAAAPIKKKSATRTVSLVQHCTSFFGKHSFDWAYISKTPEKNDGKTMRILIDTNIIIDILEKREPYFEESYKVLRKCLEEGIECLVTASAATDIFYLLRKFFRSSRMAKDYLEQLFWLVTFADVQALDIQNTLSKSMTDFEDAVVNAVAERWEAEWIVTRNIKDFVNSTVPAVPPVDFLNADIH